MSAPTLIVSATGTAAGSLLDGFSLLTVAAPIAHDAAALLAAERS